jgi:hypothetical protein
VGSEFHTAEETSLELSTGVPRDRTIWYVPQAHSNDVDWFNHVENTGGVPPQEFVLNFETVIQE